jgi:CDP-diacylglycerol--glycerol-3-phosphate 3-phosphatidyltransferase
MNPPFWNVPNTLSLSRLPLSAVVFAAISYSQWTVALSIFLIAAFTDWLDGWWARKFNEISPIGRSLDPLTDKVLVGGTFIYLLIVPASQVLPWMVTLILSRELLITGLRGMVEANGKKFGADWFGKLKTILQMVVLVGVLLIQTLREWAVLPDLVNLLDEIYRVLLYAMLVATLGSGIQYTVKAIPLLR